MTGILLLDKYNFNDYITTRYPDNYEYEGKVAYIPENIEISIENLLELLLVYSANDAAYIAALSVSENLDSFINLMNNKAKVFGMNNTNYTNPDGIDEENHYTTLNDLLKLSIKASENIEIVSLVSKKKIVSDISGTEKVYNNTNLILDDGFVGLKTGWTDKAGLTFVGLNQSNERNIITIVNKSFVDEKKYSHFSDTKLLYKTSIESFDNFNILDKNSDFYNIRNSNNTITIKSESVWNEFINLNKKENLKLSDYKDKEISFSFMKYINKFNIEDSDYKVKWSFNPLKIFQLNANQ
jgi:D-alanyl-D-alanine carboxypeptidase (penicillin-binding protein 5/6)